MALSVLYFEEMQALSYAPFERRIPWSSQADDSTKSDGWKGSQEPCALGYLWRCDFQIKAKIYPEREISLRRGGSAENWRGGLQFAATVKVLCTDLRFKSGSTETAHAGPQAKTIPKHMRYGFPDRYPRLRTIPIQGRSTTDEPISAQKTEDARQQVRYRAARTAGDTT